MIRKILSALALSLALTFGAYAQAPAANSATSAGATPLRIGVLDVPAAIANTNEGRRDLEALQKKFEPKQSELKTQNDDVENLKKQLSATGDKLSEDERNNRVRAIETKQKNLQRSLEDAQSDFQAQQNEILARIYQKMSDVLQKYAMANNLALVLDVSTQQNPVIWAAEQINITKPVIDAYNAQSGVAAQPAAPAGAKPPGSSVTSPRPAGTGVTSPRPATPPAAKKPAPK